ncbi:hypothetical protein AVEN_6023-1, partial [Araneus ventricosus]
ASVLPVNCNMPDAKIGQNTLQGRVSDPQLPT